ncbi:conserved exported hypothetical protein [Candidatus Nitrospira nitrosa]|uniref:Ice-binding protein C-terminal domain-containing protein n=1 Tax=Candidatus Nitrospira nitrosa TaxID=1742972 RepID=A0A0S4L5M0_9BACT|nr:PEP-CTERM sorting domain-containing protein [Candidatus Nitrospira nitrosa]CUS32089.1 conserved exported hypothetical protein [Candidatus Nitrospira nitrosa]
MGIKVRMGMWVFLSISLLSSGHVLALPTTWVDWTSAGSGPSATSTGSANGVTVSFTGDIYFTQAGGGVNYWSVSPSTYTQPPAVDNPPPSSDIIALTGGPGTGIQTLTFSTPVVNPVMALLSVGAPGTAVTYDFSVPFNVLNTGPGYWGSGFLASLPGDLLLGEEGHGLILFPGTFTSISWINPTGEAWHGFTVGLPGSAAPVPEPSTLLLLGSGLLCLVPRVRRLMRTDE